MIKKISLLFLFGLLCGCTDTYENVHNFNKLCKNEPRTFTYEQGALNLGWKITVTCTEPANRPVTDVD